MTLERLAEVSEPEARGQVAATYEDIRRTLGSPVVNLVYRHLAVEPQRLEDVWSQLRPNLASQAAASAARRLVEAAALPGVFVVPPSAPAAIGADADRTGLVRATLNVYARANSRNLLGMQALLHGCPGGGEGGDAEEAPPLTQILPMTDLATLPPPTLALLDEMSATLVGDAEPRLVPSLLRHFAGDAPLLAFLWTALKPEAADLEVRRAAVAAEARDLAGRLPFPVFPFAHQALRETTGRFAAAMSAMLVAGEGIRAALALGGG